MLNLCSGSLRLTAPRAAVTALYFFRLQEFYTANPVFCQKYRLILAYISTIECHSQRRWANRCPQNLWAAPTPTKQGGAYMYRRSHYRGDQRSEIAADELDDKDVAKCDTLAAVGYRGNTAHNSTQSTVYWGVLVRLNATHYNAKVEGNAQKTREI